MFQASETQAGPTKIDPTRKDNEERQRGDLKSYIALNFFL